jgi:hypothetical protein
MITLERRANFNRPIEYPRELIILPDQLGAQYASYSVREQGIEFSNSNIDGNGNQVRSRVAQSLSSR